MMYRYICDECINEVSISKPMSESNKKEKCLKCGKELRRLWTPPSIVTGDGKKQ